MKKAATLSSKNQVTIPAEIRKLLGLKAGEVLVFDVEAVDSGPKVTLRRYPSLEEIAGSVPVPSDVPGLTWAEIRERAWNFEAPKKT
jgi:AbrB family looped-hinge helix DNA binding protein